jgi:hypothetical protein
MENYLLNISVLERVLDKQIVAKNKRTEMQTTKTTDIKECLEKITSDYKIDIQSQYISKRLSYSKGSSMDTSTLSKQVIQELEEAWRDLNQRIKIVPGKETLRRLREIIQNKYGVNLTDVQIIDEFNENEIPRDLKTLIFALEDFRIS